MLSKKRVSQGMHILDSSYKVDDIPIEQPRESGTFSSHGSVDSANRAQQLKMLENIIDN